MNILKELIAYISMHGPALVAIVLTLLAAAEMIVRLTPTAKDDAAVERLGKIIRKFFDLLHVPNHKSGGGNHPALAEKEIEK